MSDETTPITTLERLEAVDNRLRDLEQRIGALAQIVGVMVDTLGRLQIEETQLNTSSKEFSLQSSSIPISSGIAHVVKLVHEGQNEEAQRELQALPAEELADQPAAVALVAAALCIQRGDYHSGKKALERARELADDPRLLHVLELMTEQARQ